MNGPTPRRLRYFVTRRLRLRQYLREPGDGRRQPQIPAELLLWALLVGQILRQNSFHAIEALVHSPARRNLPLSASFSDDALAKSRWEIENEGFNEAKSRHGLEHICHHHANSLLILGCLPCWP